VVGPDTESPHAATRQRAQTPLAANAAGHLDRILAVFHRTSLGVAGLIAAERFHISSAQLATFTMVQLFVYAAMQIPVGRRSGPGRCEEAVGYGDCGLH